jgi:hypothetical protein
MAEEHTVTNATLYSLLQTVYKLLQTMHLNQTQIIIPDLASQTTNLAALQIDIDLKLAALDAKLDQLIVQVTPPETGDFNP